MADSQHGRHCGCAECLHLAARLYADRVSRESREPFRETATVEQLRDSYEAALDEMQVLCERLPAARMLDPLRTFLNEAGRKVR
jgi:hypothetical protein